MRGYSHFSKNINPPPCVNFSPERVKIPCWGSKFRKLLASCRSATRRLQNWGGGEIGGGDKQTLNFRNFLLGGKSHWKGASHAKFTKISFDTTRLGCSRQVEPIISVWAKNWAQWAYSVFSRLFPKRKRWRGSEFSLDSALWDSCVVRSGADGIRWFRVTERWLFSHPAQYLAPPCCHVSNNRCGL